MPSTILVKEIHPRSARATALNAPRFCMGISLDNPLFSRSNLHAFFKWFSPRPAPLLLFLGDSLYLETSLLFFSCDENAALARTKATVEQMITNINMAAESLFPTCRLVIEQLSRIEESPAYKEVYASISWIINHNPR